MFAVSKLIGSVPPRMAVVITEAIFWHCQNSPSTDVHGSSSVDEVFKKDKAAGLYRFFPAAQGYENLRFFVYYLRD